MRERIGRRIVDAVGEWSITLGDGDTKRFPAAFPVYRSVLKEGEKSA